MYLWGGGLATRPYTFTMQVWYRDIVYDDSAPDDHYTSLDVYTEDPAEPGSPVMVFVHGGGFRVGDKASSRDPGHKPEYFGAFGPPRQRGNQPCLWAPEISSDNSHQQYQLSSGSSKL